MMRGNGVIRGAVNQVLLRIKADFYSEPLLKYIQSIFFLYFYGKNQAFHYDGIRSRCQELLLQL